MVMLYVCYRCGEIQLKIISCWVFMVFSICPHLASFLRYSDIMVENSYFNLPYRYLAPPLGMIKLEFRTIFDIRKLFPWIS